MANELKHGSVGTELTQAEWEAVGAHVLESQATGDIVYAESASQLRRLGVGSNTHVLTLAAGVPSWAAPAAAAAGRLTGSTLASGVVTTSITTVGALASGTIASGFGTINNGSSTITTTGAVATGALTAGGILKTDDATEATSTTDGSLQTDGGLSVAKDAIIGDDLTLLSDGAVFAMGLGSDFTITHDGSTAATIDVGGSGGSITNVGASGNDWTQNALTLAGGTATQILKLETTGTAKTATLILKTPASSTDERAMEVIFRQGSGNGTANNMEYFLNYAATSGYLRLNSADTDGSATRADIWRVPDGQSTILYNATHPTGTFDYVCGSCGRHEATEFTCCGPVRWHDDVMDFRAMALRDEEGLNYMERIGVIKRSIDNAGKPEIFTVLGKDFEFAMSAAFQNRQRMDAQYEEMNRRLDRIETALGV